MGFWVVHGEDRPGAPYAGARPKTKRDTGRRGAPADPATRPLGAHPLVWLEALGNIHAGHVYRLTAVSKTWGNIIRGEPLLFSNTSEPSAVGRSVSPAPALQWQAHQPARQLKS